MRNWLTFLSFLFVPALAMQVDKHIRRDGVASFVSSAILSRLPHTLDTVEPPLLNGHFSKMFRTEPRCFVPTMPISALLL